MVLTETIPGPKGKAALNDLALFSIDHYNRNTFANPEKSFLNFLKTSFWKFIFNTFDNY